MLPDQIADDLPLSEAGAYLRGHLARGRVAALRACGIVTVGDVRRASDAALRCPTVGPASVSWLRHVFGPAGRVMAQPPAERLP